MPGLLDIPSELLYQIIEIAVDPQDAPKGRYRPEQLRCRTVMCYAEPSFDRLTGHSLLLSCRKLNIETSLVLAKLPQTFELDLAVVDFHWIWPFGRKIPVKKAPGTQERLVINLIYCFSDMHRAGYNFAPEKHVEVELETFNVIGLFLRQGLDYIGVNEPHLHFKSMSMNLDATRHKNGREPFSEIEIPCRTGDGLWPMDFNVLAPVESAMCSEHVRWIGRKFKSLLERSDYDLVICERVDELTISIDGKTIRKVDIAGDVRGKPKEETGGKYKYVIPKPSGR